MKKTGDLSIFFNPNSIAVIGASERQGSWGSFIMRNLLSRKYGGDIYPVNIGAARVYDIPAFKDVQEITGIVDLAVLTIPEGSLEEVIISCGQKQVRGVIIVAAGFGETSEQGLDRERALVRLAKSYGIRILGPNSSGAFNLHDHFLASGARSRKIQATSLAAITQGGFAFQDMLASGANRGMGVGKFIHTGNECDLTATDFLEYYGQDPDVKAIVLYLESIRDSRRFIDIAKKVTSKKPVVVYKGGRTPGSARAARSHTAAFAGKKEIYQGLFHQVGIIISPTMELLLPLGHALIERPPMRGKRVGIVTQGGSWGVALSDALEEAGLSVPELDSKLQKHLHGMGMPERASTRNPIDIGAVGPSHSIDMTLAIGREVLASGEIDSLILHGIGRPGMLDDPDSPIQPAFLDIEKRFIQEFSALEKEAQTPVLIGCHYTPWESQAISDLNKQGIRIYNRIDEIAQLLSLMFQYWKLRLT